MRKFILIPVVKMGKEPKGLFLEIISEPSCFGGVDFQNLKNNGLAEEVAITEKILNRLKYLKTTASQLYLSGYFLNINNLSISLGLTLSAFLQQKNCRYNKIIVLGEIDVNSSQLLVSGGPFFETQIATILSLGRQPSTVALFVPAQLLIGSQHDLSNHLAELNIELKVVATLYDALSRLGVA